MIAGQDSHLRRPTYETGGLDLLPTPRFSNAGCRKKSARMLSHCAICCFKKIGLCGQRSITLALINSNSVVYCAILLMFAAIPLAVSKFIVQVYHAQRPRCQAVDRHFDFFLLRLLLPFFLPTQLLSAFAARTPASALAPRAGKPRAAIPCLSRLRHPCGQSRPCRGALILVFLP